VTYLDVQMPGTIIRTVIDPASVSVDTIDVNLLQVTIPNAVNVAGALDIMGFEQDSLIVANRFLSRANEPPQQNDANSLNTFLIPENWRLFQLATYFITVAVSNPDDDILSEEGGILRNSAAHFNFLGDDINIENDNHMYRVTPGNGLDGIMNNWIESGTKIQGMWFVDSDSDSEDQTDSDSDSEDRTTTT
jgi:hypothetical protein